MLGTTLHGTRFNSRTGRLLLCKEIRFVRATRLALLRQARKAKQPKKGCIGKSVTANLLAGPEQSYKPYWTVTETATETATEIVTEVTSNATDRYVKERDWSVKVLGQCFNGSRQTALMTCRFVFVDDVFISHAINHAGCFLQDISSN